MHATDNPIRAGIAYIEENLKSDLSIAEIASHAGYSVYHYCRLFSKEMGMPVAEYINKRRLAHALWEILAGKRAVDVVLAYGFDTYAGFYKAFVRLHGCSPRKYAMLYPGRQPIPTIPEVKDRMKSEKELRQLLTHWEIDNRLPIENIYLADDASIPGPDWRVGTEYILSSGERPILLKRQRIARALAAQGFQAFLPVKTKEGADILDGADAYYLTRGLPGAPLDTQARMGEDRYRHGVQYGEAIARLHAALRQVQRECKADEASLYDTVNAWALPAVRLQDRQWSMGLGEAFFDDWQTTFGTLYKELPRQLIHRDIHPSNILFEDGKVSGFLGFESSEINVRLFDPCFCATGILSEAGSLPAMYEKWPEILRGILHGYDSVSPLAEAEKRAVYYVICAIEMICIAYFQSVDAPAFRKLAQTNREMLSFIVKSADTIKGSL